MSDSGIVGVSRDERSAAPNPKEREVPSAELLARAARPEKKHVPDRGPTMPGPGAASTWLRFADQPEAISGSERRHRICVRRSG